MNRLSALKRVLLGRRLASKDVEETLLPKRLALPVFASDALSSVAYAPGEILVVLSVAGMSAYAFSWQIGIAVAFVIAIVVLSYRQTVVAYPNGGGVYEVARANFGRKVSLTAASALMVDYCLTVAVSVAAGIENAEAMIPAIRGNEVWLALVVIAFLALMNVRGVRESGWFFAWPTYIFICSTLLMIIVGFVRILVFGEPLQAETAHLTVIPPHGAKEATGALLILILLRAFSSGCAALTGVEAVSNGVPAFRQPKSKNAAIVLASLGALAITMLVGILVLARLTNVRMIDELLGSRFLDSHGNIIHTPASTVIGQLARVVFYDWAPVMFFITVGATVVILFMAANTAFAGFPGLTSILGRDDYLPRQLHSRGDRLSYSNGILLLALVAAGLVVTFQASVTALIQLYVVGVFISFTIGQLGMVRHWTKLLRFERKARVRSRMRRARLINIVGFVCTSVVLTAVLVSKFIHGAWIALAAMGLIYLFMRAIKKHYNSVNRELACDAEDRILPSRVRAVVFVKHVNKPTVKTVEYAKATRPTTLAAITVAIDDDAVQRVSEDWIDQDLEVPLTVLASPYREVTGPFINYVSALRSKNPRDVVAVYIPEYVVGRWWERALHNQTEFMIRARLHFMQGVMVISVPYQLHSSARAKKRLDSHAALRKGTWRRR